MPDPFITTTDLENYLGRELSADPGATIAVDAACDMCRTIAEQQFNRGTSTVWLDGSGTDALRLAQYPAGTVTAVSVSGSAVSDYVLDETNGVLIRKVTDTSVADWNTDYRPTTIVWPCGRQNIEVTYEHGYADGDVPRDVRMVALAYASRLVVQGPVLRESSGQQTIAYAIASTDLTKGEKAILRKHRH